MLFEFDDTKNAIINPSNFINKVKNMPDVAIACFSKTLFEKIVDGAKCSVIGTVSNTNGARTIYEIEYNDKNKWYLKLIDKIKSFLKK